VWTPNSAAEFLDSLVGISADPSDPRRDEFATLIAEDETPERVEAMLTESTCALAVKGYFRHFIPRQNWPEWLRAPYVNTQAPADVQRIARLAGAVMPAGYIPTLGDVVHLAAGQGGPEHLYMVRDTDPNPYGGTDVDSVDGGQKLGTFQAIKARQRIIVPKGTQADDQELAESGGSYSAIRPVWMVYNVARIMEVFA